MTKENKVDQLFKSFVLNNFNNICWKDFLSVEGSDVPWESQSLSFDKDTIGLFKKRFNNYFYNEADRSRGITHPTIIKLLCVFKCYFTGETSYSS